jgi:hypothetical protein
MLLALGHASLMLSSQATTPLAERLGTEYPEVAQGCRLARRTKVVSYLRYWGRTGRTTATAVVDPVPTSPVRPSIRDEQLKQNAGNVGASAPLLRHALPAPNQAS